MDRMGTMVCTAAALACVAVAGQRMRWQFAQRRGASRERAERMDFAVVGVRHGSATTTCSAPAS